MSTCGVDGRPHTYTFAGTVYSDGPQRPGSSSHERIYEDKFYCQHCLDVQYRNPRNGGSTYNRPAEGMLPK